MRVAIDRNARALVAFQGSVTQIPDLFQSNSVDFQVYVVEETGNVAPRYQLADMSNYGLRISIGTTPTGTSGGPTPVALQDTFTLNAAGYFEGTLAMNTAAVDALIGSSVSVGAYIEFNLTYLGTRITIYQNTCTLKAVVDELTSTSPAATDVYLTKAESLNTFCLKVGELGFRLVLRSANGTYGRELGVDNDGSPIDNIITL